MDLSVSEVKPFCQAADANSEQEYAPSCFPPASAYLQLHSEREELQNDQVQEPFIPSRDLRYQAVSTQQRRRFGHTLYTSIVFVRGGILGEGGLLLPGPWMGCTLVRSETQWL